MLPYRLRYGCTVAVLEHVYSKGERLKHTMAYSTHIDSTTVNAHAQLALGWQWLTDRSACSKLSKSVRTQTRHIETMKEHGEARDAAVQMSSTVIPPRRAVEEDRAVVEWALIPGRGSTPTPAYAC